MTQLLRANTQVKVVIGPVVAVGDGFTPVTTLDLSTADEAELLKHDAAAVTSISAATFAAITSADGYYNLTLTTSHTDTEGLLTVLANDDSLCLPVKQCFMVLSEAAWDSIFVAKDDGFMDVNIKTIGRADTQETEASNLEAAAAAYSVTRGLSGTALPAAAADAAGGLIISDAGGLDADAQLVTKINDILTDTGTTLQGELDGIQADTEDIQSRLPAALTAGGNIKADSLAFSGSTAAADNAEIVFATDFATNYNTTLDKWSVNVSHLDDTSLEASGVLGPNFRDFFANDGDVSTFFLRMLFDDGTATYDRTTDSLQAIRDNMGTAQTGDSYAIVSSGTHGNAALKTLIDAIEAQTDDIGAAGAGLTAVPWNASWDAEVQSEVADALAAYDPPTHAETSAILTTALTESYATDGSTATVAQLLYMLWSAVSQFDISSTTLTTRKLDGSTQSMAFTLDDASDPTSRTRAS